MAPKNIAENICVAKTYYIRKVKGGRVSGRALKKKSKCWSLFHVPLPPCANTYLSSIKHFIPGHLYHCLTPTKFGCYHPVSHSWTEDMSPMDSPVNAHEWPIPLPHGVTLEVVHNELLNLGAQYVWLNVVCLRQKCLDSSRETQ